MLELVDAFRRWWLKELIELVQPCQRCGNLQEKFEGCLPARLEAPERRGRYTRPLSERTLRPTLQQAKTPRAAGQNPCHFGRAN